MIIWIVALAACTVAGAVEGYISLVNAHTAENTLPGLKDLSNQRFRSHSAIGRSVKVYPPTATCGFHPKHSTLWSLEGDTLQDGPTGDPTYDLLVKLQRDTESYQPNHGHRKWPLALLCVTKPCPGRRHPVQHEVQGLTMSEVRLGGRGCSGVKRSGGRSLTGTVDHPCAVDLGPITAQDKYTLSFWTRAAHGNTSGVVMEIGELQISVMPAVGVGRHFSVRVTSPRSLLTYQVPHWSATRWNHVALQVDRTSRQVATLFHNGRPPGDVIKADLSDPRRKKMDRSNMSAVYIGSGSTPVRRSEDGVFDGVVNKVKLYNAILTEREIYQLYSGVFEPTPGPFNDCLCPEKYPFLNKQDGGSSCCTSSSCKGSEDSQRIVRQTYGLPSGAILVGPEAVVDGTLGPYVWVSTPGVTSVSLDIDLGKATEVASVHIILHTPPPEQGVMLYSKLGDKWRAWHYFSFSCNHFTPSRQGPDVHQPTCKQLGRGNASNNIWHLKWRRTSGGPLSSPDILHTGVVRVELLGLPIRGRDAQENRLPYHVISEILISERNIPIERKLSSLGLRPDFRKRQQLHKGPSPEVPHLRRKRQADQAEVFEVLPPYGPVSGELIQITGAYFDPNVTVSFKTGSQKPATEVECSCTEQIKKEGEGSCSTTDKIICYFTIPPGAGIQLDQPLEVVVRSPDGSQALTNETHTYTPKPDPLIVNVEPRKTFISGGVKTSVSGQELTSVFQPRMILSVTYPDRTKQFGESTVGPPCEVTNSSIMTCRVPRVSLPKLYSQFISRRRKRSLHPYEAPVGEVGSLKVEVGQRRVKRQDDGADRRLFLNDDTMDVDIGFLLGGASQYNITQTISDVMRVARDPFISRFKDDIYSYRLYSPYNEEELAIQGDYLDRGARIEDYEATVGDEPCVITGLITNTLYCRPPSTKPTSGTFTKNGNPRVLVSVGNLDFSPGYVDYQYKKPVNLTVIIGAVVTVVVVIILIIIGICCWRMIRRSSKSDELDDEHDYTTLLTAERNSVLDLLDEELKMKIADCTIASECLSRHKEIGQGNFGKVFLGNLSTKREGVNHNQSVAVKTIRGQGVTLRQVSEFLEEATIMKDFEHPNVLSLLGVVIQDNRPYVLLPYMANGDLKSYITKPDKEFLVVDLLGLAVQVSEGMTYLSAQKFVHRDLRAVNCMVDENITVKVGDFGLARDMYQGDYYKVQDQMRPLPVKWMAPESLSGGVFSSRTDVWSFGVVLWETMTRGLKPYAAIDNFQMREYLMRGHRLEKPEYCPEKVYEQMQACWSVDPHKRPTFVQISAELTDFIEDTTSPGYQDIAPKNNEDYIEVKRPPTILNEYVTRPSSSLPDYLALVEGPVPDQDYLKPDSAEAGATTHQYKNDRLELEVITPHYENQRHSGYLAPTVEPGSPEDSGTLDSPNIPMEHAPGAPDDASETRVGGKTDNPYFVNPPISADYVSPEGQEKLDHSEHPPRGFLANGDPDYVNQKKNTMNDEPEALVGSSTGISTTGLLANGDPDYVNQKKNTMNNEPEESVGSSTGISARAAMFGGAVSKSPDYANQPAVQMRKKNRKPQVTAGQQTVPVTGVPHRGNETDGYVTTT